MNRINPGLPPINQFRGYQMPESVHAYAPKPERPEIINVMENGRNLSVPGSRYSQVDRFERAYAEESEESKTRRNYKAMLFGSAVFVLVALGDYYTREHSDVGRQSEPDPVVQDGYYYDRDSGYYYYLED